MKILLRVHHILCTSLFRGEGYSEGFCRNMENITNTFRSNPDTYVIPVCGPDSVCQYCPHLTCANTCDREDNRIAAKDRRLAEILALKENHPYTYRDLRRIVLEKLTEAHFEEICGDCSWNAAGLCTYVTLVQKLR